jgi:hypothetical protein
MGSPCDPERPSIFSCAALARKAERVRPCAFAAFLYGIEETGIEQLMRPYRSAGVKSNRTMARAAPSVSAAAISGSARSASTERERGNTSPSSIASSTHNRTASTALRRASSVVEPAEAKPIQVRNHRRNHKTRSYH